MNKEKKQEEIYNIKTTLYHKVRNYELNEEEMKTMNRAVNYADTCFPFRVFMTDNDKESITLSLEGVPEYECDTAVKNTALKISGFMYIESARVRAGLRKKRSFMFRSQADCPVEKHKIQK